MYLHIDEVEMTNFLAWEHYKIRFKPGMTLIQGQNGVGKSAIIDAISVALFNKPIRNISLPDVINKDATYTHIIVKGKLDDTLFTMNYKRTLTENGSNYKVKLETPEETFTNINEVKKYFKSHGLSYTVWKTIAAITPQTIPQNIGDYKYVKPLIETLLNFEEFDAYADKINTIHKEYSAHTNRLQAGLKEANSNIRQFSLRIKQINQKLKENEMKLNLSNVKTLYARKEELEKDRDYLQSELDNIPPEVSSWDSLLATKQVFLEQKKTYTQLLNAKMKSLTQYKSQLKLNKESLNSVRKRVCPVCGQALKDNSLEVKYQTKIDELTKIVDDLSSNVRDLQLKIVTADKEITRVNAEINKIKPLKEKYNDITNRLIKLRTQLKTIEADIKKYKINPDTIEAMNSQLLEELQDIVKKKERLTRVTVEYLKDKIASIEDIKLLLYHVRQALSSKKNRALLVKDVLSYIYDYLNNLLNMFELEYPYQLGFEYLDGDVPKYKVIVKGDVAKQIDGLSAGQIKLISVLFSIAVSLIYRSKYGDTNILFLDDVFDTLDIEKIRKLVDFIAKLPLQSVYILTHMDLTLPEINTVILRR